MRWPIAFAVTTAFAICLASLAYGSARDRSLDARLAQRLHELGFTGRVESTLTSRLGQRLAPPPLHWLGFPGPAGSRLTSRLGRPLDPPLADTGRLLWFDTVTGLNGDNR